MRIVGNSGETRFYQFYKKDGLVPGEGKYVDFINVHTKETCELKTDQYKFPEETNNIFIEKYSNKEKRTLGGPYRAMRDNINYFCYYFINSKKCFWWDVKTLVNYIERNQENFKTKIIFNKSYDTQGMIIPFEEIEDLVIKEDEF